jgi:hypothetical protein
MKAPKCAITGNNRAGHELEFRGVCPTRFWGRVFAAKNYARRSAVDNPELLRHAQEYNSDNFEHGGCSS